MKTGQIWILTVVILMVSTIAVLTQTGEKVTKQTSLMDKKSTVETPIEGTDVVIKVVAYKDNVPAANEYLKPEAGNKLVAVQVIMDNSKGTEDWSVEPSYLKLKDSEGNVYERYDFESVSPSLKSVVADSGDVVKGWVTFQVSSGVNIRSLKIRYEQSSEIKSGWIELKNVINK